jgi:quercetin dioxygenase-like cupin family protein
MLNSHFKIAYNQIVDGVKIKILHHDDSMIMTELVIQRGALLPEHFHQNNHSAYLLQGKIHVIVDDVVSEFIKGDSWCMKKNILHYTEALEDSVLLEVFGMEGEIEGFQTRTNVNKLEI